ncbi:protease complex subunit PrcB family protein [Thermoproteota archaeon]
MLLESEKTQATDQDFISILLSRGDKPTGGYTIQIENFAWLESYPVKFLFQVNFTDPGEGVMVTETLTNTLVLVPIGKLITGEYKIEIPIVQYIHDIDEEGNPYYTQILTFAPVIWKETLTIIKPEDSTPSRSFEVILNGNEAPDLTIHVDLTNGLTEDESKKIAEAAFIRTLE